MLIIVSMFVERVAAQATSQAPATKKEAAPVPVPVEEGKAVLSPKNSTIQFIGLHTGDEPNPRTGYFAKFTGELAIDEATGAPRAAAVEIETPSLVTPIGRLTGHLHSPDFFDVRQFPKARFKTTKISATDAAGGKYNLTGDLTIRDVTKSISIPATVKVDGEGATLTSKFKIKRSDFGLTFGPDRIVDEVSMTVTVGRATPKIEQE
jgi:polyisoprenoid-binding protein YceI